MARSSLQIVVDQRTPITINEATSRGGRPLLRKVIRQLEGILGGAVSASNIQFGIDGAQPIAASGSITCAAVAAADTVSINAQALTATQKRASCTVTCASVSAADTVTVNGSVFTAVNGGTPTAAQFDMSGSDTADAAALVAAINATTDVLVAGIIKAKSAAGVVTIYSVATGTAGNAYTITTSNGTRLAITNDSSGLFANGAADANNVFDPMGSDIETATELARALNASTTAIVSKHVEASNWAGSVTLATCLAGTIVRIAGHEFVATNGVNSPNVAGYGDFDMSSTDTNDAVALKNAINAHPVLSHDVFATSSVGVVTIRQRRGTAALGRITIEGIAGVTPSGAAATTQFVATSVVAISAKHEGQSGNAVTTASSNGTRLAVTGSAARLSGGTGAASGTQVRMVIGKTAQ